MEENKKLCCDEGDCEHHHEDCDCEDNCNCDTEEYNADGLQADEHILDMLSEADILFDNIKDNTNVAFEILKSVKEKEDNDFVDSVTIYCSDILEEEKRATEIYDKIKVIEENIRSKMEFNQQKIKQLFDLTDEYFSALILNEKKSKDVLTKLIKSIK